MLAKEIAKYALVFAAGAFAVLGIIGLNSLLQPSSLQSGVSADSGSDQQQATTAESNQEIESKIEAETTTQKPKLATNEPAESSSPVSDPTFTGKPVDGVSSITALVRNTMVTIEGTVTRASEEDEFIIKDSTGSVQVYTGRTFYTVQVGDVVSVSGLVDESAQLEVYADEIRFEDGTILKVRHWR